MQTAQSVYSYMYMSLGLTTWYCKNNWRLFLGEEYFSPFSTFVSCLQLTANTDDGTITRLKPCVISILHVSMSIGVIHVQALFRQPCC